MTSIASMVALISCDGSSADSINETSSELDPRRADLPSVAVEVPLFELDQGVFDRFNITADGNMLLDDEPILLGGQQQGELGETIEIRTPAIMIAPEVASADAVRLLQSIVARNGDAVYFPDINEMPRFASGMSPDHGAANPGQFFGEARRHEFPVSVTIDAAGGCVASVNGRRVSSDALYDDGFVALDNWVQRAGGVEAFMLDDAMLAEVRATIQTPPATPWRCLGRAAYDLSAAGYPKLQFEILAFD